MTVKDFITREKKAYFMYYRQGYFYYAVEYLDTLSFYTFPIPFSDIGTATLLFEDKSIHLMRWIRKAIAEGTMVKTPNPNLKPREI